MKKLTFFLLLAMIAGCSRDPNAERDKYFASGQKYLDSEKYEEAAIEFRNALQKDKGHVPSYLGLADVLRPLGDHNAAVAAYGMVLKLDGDNIKAKLNLTEYILATGAGDSNLLKKAVSKVCLPI